MPAQNRMEQGYCRAIPVTSHQPSPVVFKTENFTSHCCSPNSVCLLLLIFIFLFCFCFFLPEFSPFANLVSPSCPVGSWDESKRFPPCSPGVPSHPEFRGTLAALELGWAGPRGATTVWAAESSGSQSRALAAAQLIPSPFAVSAKHRCTATPEAKAAEAELQSACPTPGTSRGGRPCQELF